MSNPVVFIAHGPFGPDLDRAIKDDLALTWDCSLQPSQRAVFSFTSEAAKELAFILYRKGDMVNVLEVGSPPFRGWADHQITEPGQYLLTAWQKDGAPVNWHQASIRSVSPPVGFLANWEVEDDQHDGDWNDIRIFVRIV